MRRLALVVMLSAATSASAQTRPEAEANPVAHVRRALESEGTPGFALPILRQQYASTSFAQRDSIAELLVRAAVASGSSDLAYEKTRAIVSVLKASGRDVPEGVRYSGAVAALMVLARDSDYTLSVMATTGLRETGDVDAAAAGLLELATSDRKVAAHAVSLLASARSPRMQRQFEGLCRRGAALVNPEAERRLQVSVREKGLRVGRCAP